MWVNFFEFGSGLCDSTWSWTAGLSPAICTTEIPAVCCGTCVACHHWYQGASCCGQLVLRWRVPERKNPLKVHDCYIIRLTSSIYIYIYHRFIRHISKISPCAGRGVRAVRLQKQFTYTAPAECGPRSFAELPRWKVTNARQSRWLERMDRPSNETRAQMSTYICFFRHAWRKSDGRALKVTFHKDAYFHGKVGSVGPRFWAVHHAPSSRQMGWNHGRKMAAVAWLERVHSVKQLLRRPCELGPFFPWQSQSPADLWGTNLMASATLELLEFIRLQNLKVLANLLVEGLTGVSPESHLLKHLLKQLLISSFGGL